MIKLLIVLFGIVAAANAVSFFDETYFMRDMKLANIATKFG